MSDLYMWCIYYEYLAFPKDPSWALRDCCFMFLHCQVMWSPSGT